MNFNLMASRESETASVDIEFYFNSKGFPEMGTPCNSQNLEEVSGEVQTFLEEE